MECTSKFPHYYSRHSQEPCGTSKQEIDSEPYWLDQNVRLLLMKDRELRVYVSDRRNARNQGKLLDVATQNDPRDDETRELEGEKAEPIGGLLRGGSGHLVKRKKVRRQRKQAHTATSKRRDGMCRGENVTLPLVSSRHLKHAQRRIIAASLWDQTESWRCAGLVRLWRFRRARTKHCETWSRY